ncbi:MAG TPA: hypothetical protein PLP29_16445 [Candidatus Ozemobacteraceae bacterium]|nr:hypothetical protein [Candidatus Ozemobacteraceae bacterium]
MATSAIMRSLAFFEARLTSESVTLLGGGREGDAAKQTASATDGLSVSAFAGLRQTIDTFRRGTEGDGRLDVTFNLPQDRLYSQVGDRKTGRDFDLMLRLLARDDEDYRRLRERFDKLMELASGSFESQSTVSSSGSGEAVVVSGEAETPAEPAVEASDRDERFRRDLEIAEAFVARVERRQVEVRVQVTRVDQRFEVQGIDMRQADPLVLDLEGDGLDLAKAGEGAVFDVNADGTLDRTGWVRGDDALLVYDRNGNGRIDDGRELFGDQNGAAHGFAELARQDENRDNRIDAKDSIFKALQLYRDLNGNGKIDAGELSKLSQHGIVSLNLRFMRESAMINGNTLLMKGSFQRADGTTGRMDDVLFGFRDNR